MDNNKNNRISKRRLIALASAIGVVFGMYSLRLFQIQLVEGEYYAAKANSNTTLSLPISASRGEILDSALRPMAVNRTSYEVVFDYNYFPIGTGEEQRARQNAIIWELIQLLDAKDEDWNDTLPISADTPYTFEEDRDKDIAKLKSRLRMADYATAENCMTELSKRYCLSTYTQEQQRLLAGVQYEMELREFGYWNPFTFSSDISKDTSYQISENNTRFPGVNIQPTAVREYVSGETAAHLIGTVGPMYAEDYEKLKDQGYALNDILGKSGVESAFESSLRGTAGTRTLVKDTAGNVLDAYESEAPVPGQSVVLTLDSDLQNTAQQALADMIAQLRALPAKKGNGAFWGNGHDVSSGAVVALDMQGGVLACASWPPYDLATYQEKYNELLKDPDKPLFNRALYGAFACGSTMKPCVALAALTEGTITPTTPIYCGHTYTHFSKTNPLHCMGTHRNISVVQALTKSCNIFFYETGRLLGIDKMNEYSAQFGLGQKTGIEIGESAGVLAGPAHSEAVGTLWTEGQTVTAAIGQSDNLFTPIQLATYAMTVGNDGVRYKTHLLRSLRSYNGVETPYEPEVEARAELSDEAIETVRKGMIGAASAGGTAGIFAGASYHPAAKTGTAQIYNDRSDHGVFIAYAPAENPEIAIAVVLENGTSSPSTKVAKTVLDAYFAAKTDDAAATPEGELLP